MQLFNQLTSSARLTLLSALLLLLFACGQKGPLEVERIPPVQEETPEETK